MSTAMESPTCSTQHLPAGTRVHGAFVGLSFLAGVQTLHVAGVPDHPEGHDVVVKSLRVCALQ